MAYKLFVGDDSSGKITVRALRKVARDLNENLDEEELKAMIDEFDLDQDGKSKLTSRRRRIHKNNNWRRFLLIIKNFVTFKSSIKIT